MKKPQRFAGVMGHLRKILKIAKWRGQDLNLRPRGYEPRELPGCSTPRQCVGVDRGSISVDHQKGSQFFSDFVSYLLLETPIKK